MGLPRPKGKKGLSFLKPLRDGLRQLGGRRPYAGPTRTPSPFFHMRPTPSPDLLLAGSTCASPAPWGSGFGGRRAGGGGGASASGRRGLEGSGIGSSVGRSAGWWASGGGQAQVCSTYVCTDRSSSYVRDCPDLCTARHTSVSPTSFPRSFPRSRPYAFRITLINRSASRRVP